MSASDTDNNAAETHSTETPSEGRCTKRSSDSAPKAPDLSAAQPSGHGEPAAVESDTALGREGADVSQPDDSAQPSSSSSEDPGGVNDGKAAEEDETSAGTEGGEEDDELEDRPMTLRDHLRELRKRMLYSFLFIFAGFFICYHFAQPLFELLMAPLVDAMARAMPGTAVKLQYKAPAEAFFGLMKVAFVTSLFVTSPLTFYHVWAFVAPGLHKEEKLHLLPLAFCSALCFIAGAAFCYYVAFPFIFDFLMSFNSPILESRPTVEDSLSFVLRLVVAFGCIFELPLFSFFLARLGLVTAAWMRKVRRYAILASFILAAILSPPDVMSMMLMAGPLLILYECSILVAALFGKKSPENAEEEEEEEEDDEESSTPEQKGSTT